MKIRSIDELGDALETDLSWRKKELTTINLLIQGSRSHQKEVLIRAGIALMYAHWEGHIKKASECYLCLLNKKAHKYSDLKDNFKHISLADKFSQGFSINKYESQKELFEYIYSCKDEKFCVSESNIIDTESNLKYNVLKKLMHQLGLDLTKFELKENFIDSTLLKNRNSIAHGERISNKQLETAYKEIQETIIGMIQTYHNLIYNAAVTEEYLVCET